MHVVAAALSGVVFGLGILLSGMSNPAKVLNFFDVAGTWDPSLAFVMGGALAVTFIGYRLVLSGARPAFAEAFHLPPAASVDRRLVGGAALFGVGWGIAGFCPGGLVPVLAVGGAGPLIFAAGLLVGLVAGRLLVMRRLDRWRSGAGAGRQGS